MFGRWPDWVPAITLLAGLVLVQTGSDQRAMPLRMPLAAAVPHRISGYEGSDIEVSAAEIDAIGADNWLMRSYRSDSAGLPFFTLYVGYYESQMQGRTIHSPRNCLPGAGWEALHFEAQPVSTPLGNVTVARYLVQRGAQRALVLYWYQGRGRVESGEYAVKYQLLRDAAMRGRTEEALVRIMVPITGDAAPSMELAGDVAGQVMLALQETLPEV